MTIAQSPATTRTAGGSFLLEEFPPEELFTLCLFWRLVRRFLLTR